MKTTTKPSVWFHVMAAVTVAVWPKDDVCRKGWVKIAPSGRGGASSFEHFQQRQIVFFLLYPKIAAVIAESCRQHQIDIAFCGAGRQ